MTKFALIFASKTSSGNTATAAQRLKAILGSGSTILSAREVTSPSQLEFADAYVFLSPTVGDEELQEDFETFFQRFSAGSLQPKPYAICELGNYYGYDDFEFGPASIMRHFLNEHSMKELIPSLSLDSLPEIPWDLFEQWAVRLKEAVS